MYSRTLIPVTLIFLDYNTMSIFQHSVVTFNHAIALVILWSSLRFLTSQYVICWRKKDLIWGSNLTNYPIPSKTNTHKSLLLTRTFLTIYSAPRIINIFILQNISNQSHFVIFICVYICLCDSSPLISHTAFVIHFSKVFWKSFVHFVFLDFFYSLLVEILCPSAISFPYKITLSSPFESCNLSP